MLLTSITTSSTPLHSTAVITRPLERNYTYTRNKDKRQRDGGPRESKWNLQTAHRHTDKRENASSSQDFNVHLNTLNISENNARTHTESEKEGGEGEGGKANKTESERKRKTKGENKKKTPYGRVYRSERETAKRTTER